MRVQVQKFEIYGKCVSLGSIEDMTLTHHGSDTFRCQLGHQWTLVGVTYVRGDHGFVILRDYDDDDDSV